MKRLKVGLVGLIQHNFRGDKESVYRRSIEELSELANELDFEFVWRREFVVTREDALRARLEMEDARVDFLLIQSTSFASGYLVQELARVNAFLGLWAVPETTTGGPLPLNSFCNLNLNMSQLDRFLGYLQKDAKWFYGYPKDPLFKTRFEVSLRAMRAIKNLRGSRYLLIGGRAPGFDNLFYDPRELRAKLDVQVDEMEFGDLKSRFLAQDEKKVEETLRDILERYEVCDEYAAGSLKKMARLVSVLRDIKLEGNYDGFAIACWPKFRTELGMVPCASFAYLSDETTTTVCEGDVVSLISMKFLEYIADYPALLMDLSTFDTRDDTIFLWHCGIGSKHYAKPGSLALEKHFNPGPRDPEKGWLTMAPVASMKFEPMEVTIGRITNDLRSYFVLTGQIIEDSDKPDYDGSRGWVGNLRLFGETLSVLDLINTIMVNKLEHHFPLVKGTFDEAFIEAMNWLGFAPVPIVLYKNYYERRR